MICLGKANNGFPSPLFTGRISGSLPTRKTTHLPRGVGNNSWCSYIVSIGSRIASTGGIKVRFR